MNMGILFNGRLLPFVVFILVCTFALHPIALGQTPAGAGIVEAPPAQAAQVAASTQVISFGDMLPNQPDAEVSITFSIYPEQQSTSALWTETQTVQVRGGKYSALLGSTNASGLPAAIFGANQAHWLGVQVNGVEKRYLLVSVAYALNAVNAEQLGGVPASQFATECRC